MDWPNICIFSAISIFLVCCVIFAHAHSSVCLFFSLRYSYAIDKRYCKNHSKSPQKCKWIVCAEEKKKKVKPNSRVNDTMSQNESCEQRKTAQNRNSILPFHLSTPVVVVVVIVCVQLVQCKRSHIKLLVHWETVTVWARCRFTIISYCYIIVYILWSLFSSIMYFNV